MNIAINTIFLFRCEITQTLTTMEGSSNHRGAQRTQSSQSQQNKSSCRLRFREIIDAQDWATILCDIAIIIVIIVISTLNPTTRPFLTYDATISAPYQTTNSIPYWLACIIPFLSLLFSLTIWEILPYRNTPRLTSAAASFLFFLLDFIFCFVVTVLLTETGKLVVGRYRPDWLNRCEPDASNTTIVLQWGTSAAANPSCTSSLSPSKIEDGHKSFPSGHASTAFALGVYVAGYVLWSVFYRSGQRLYYSTRREQAVKERVVHELGMACAFLWILFQLSWA